MRESLLKTSILTVTAFFLFLLPTMAGPFSDVPDKHRTYTLLKNLEEKGFIEGYPDGYFNGTRPLTRYEMAMAVARIIAKLEELQLSIPMGSDLSIYATKNDLASVNALQKEFQSELNALGVRVGDIENTLKNLETRTKEMERLKISGLIHSFNIMNGITLGNNSAFTYDQLNGLEPDYGGPQAKDAKNNLFFDYSTDLGEVVFGQSVKKINGSYIHQVKNYGNFLPGSAFTTNALIDVSYKLTDKTNMGGTMVFYSLFGDKTVAYNYGARIPCLIPSYNRAFPDGNLEARLESMWVKKKSGKSEFNVVFGDFFPRMVLEKYNEVALYHLVIRGILDPGNYIRQISLFRGPSIWVSSRLKFRGLYTYGNIGSWEYEFWGNLMSPLNYPFGPYEGFDGNYEKFSYGGRVGTKFYNDKINLNGFYFRVFEDTASAPEYDTLPQAEYMMGINGGWQVSDRIKIFGTYVRSNYDNNLRAIDTIDFGANATVAGVKFGKLFSNSSILLQYEDIGRNYEPFGIHNPTRFPSGYNGFSANWTVPLEKKGKFSIQFTYGRQKDASRNLPSYAKSDVFIDLFPILTGPSDDKGFYNAIEASADYTFDNKITIEGNLKWVKHKRTSSTPEDNTNRDILWVNGGAGYPLFDNFTVFGTFAYIGFSGSIASKVENIDNRQWQSKIGFNYTFSKDTEIRCYYKFLDFKDVSPIITSTGANDWDGSQAGLHGVLKF